MESPQAKTLKKAQKVYQGPM